MARPPLPIKTRFRAQYVKTTQCWNWIIPNHEFGYGTFTLSKNGRSWTLLAHRMSYILHVGPIPKGSQVLHKCDNPRCVNPNHLFLGTHNDNVQDCVTKGRHAKGETSGAAKLTDRAVEIIRSRKGKVSSIVLGRIFGVSYRTILYIWSHTTWKHLNATKDRP